MARTKGHGQNCPPISFAVVDEDIDGQRFGTNRSAINITMPDHGANRVATKLLTTEEFPRQLPDMERDRQPELMDDPNLPWDEHQRALRGLARLNRWSGVAGAMYSHIRRNVVASGGRPLRVLDVASGSGDVPIAWAKRAAREGLPIEITTTDISDRAVETQRRLAADAGVEIRSMQLDCVQSPLPTGFDLVTCSLFMHHLDQHQTFCLLQSMQAASENPILVCDLERSYVNLALVKIAAMTLSRSQVVHTDAVLSVRAAYTRQEFKSIAQRALARPVLVKRSFPCRFIAVLDEQMVAEPVPAFA